MTEHESQEALARLVSWLRRPEGPLPIALAADFEFDSGLQRLDANDWEWFVRQGSGWRDLQIVASLAASDGAAVVFDAIEPTTALRYRLAWIVRWQEQRLLRIVETGAVVP